jgi:predicted acyltransferase
MRTSSKRLISLDAFRGFTIVLMILVNNPGSWKYVLPPLRHAQWHGCTPTDLVFPFFLYIVGVAMAFSFAKRLALSETRWPIYGKIIRRTIILLLLGWFLTLWPRFDFAHMRIPGVLQRIALCYFFASMIVLHLKTRGQIITIGALLLGYWGLMTLIPFPGKGSDPWALGSNFAQYIDNIVLKGHMYKPDFDPEGLISTIPAICNTLLGYLTGVWLRSERSSSEKTNGMFIAANVSIFVALIWKYWMPLNKQLWTSSYVLYTTGIALNILAISYWLIDVKGHRKGLFPFIVYGSNAILAYFCSSFMAKSFYLWKITLSDGTVTSIKGFIYNNILQPFAGNWIGSLLHPLLYILLWFGILFLLYRKKIYVRI